MPTQIFPVLSAAPVSVCPGRVSTDDNLTGLLEKKWLKSKVHMGKQDILNVLGPIKKTLI